MNKFTIAFKTVKVLWVLLVILVFTVSKIIGGKIQTIPPTTQNPYTRKICMFAESALKARQKSCFLRPDTGPCRADILQWYFDVKQGRCYRFFWGGCQGNGNRFETHQECHAHCFLNSSVPQTNVPHFCSLSFDYGSCFGQYNRWGYDQWAKTCQQRLYSGCGGNQNNFETRNECINTCQKIPSNTFNGGQQLTTCIPIRSFDILKK